MSDEQWGPWIEHDGKGCPCVGSVVTIVAVKNLIGDIHELVTTAKGGNSWRWRIHGVPPNKAQRIIRYRIRKPRALQQLIDMVENLPAPVKERTDA